MFLALVPVPRTRLSSPSSLPRTLSSILFNLLFNLVDQNLFNLMDPNLFNLIDPNILNPRLKWSMLASMTTVLPRTP